MNIPQLTQDDALFGIQAKQLLLAQLQVQAMGQQLAAANARIEELEGKAPNDAKAPARTPKAAA